MFRYCLLVSLMFVTACSNFLFVPIKEYPVMPDAVNIGYQDVFFESFDSTRLHGWKLHAKDEFKGTILFFHGNGDNVSTQLPNTYWLAEKGYDVYVFDYRGYGQSAGKATLDNTIKDLEAMIAHVISKLPKEEKVIILGHSLGASMGVYSVANSVYRDRIKCLVTAAAFSDYHDIVQEVLSQSWLFWPFQWPLSYTVDNGYRPLDYIAQVSPVPVLVLHSKSDEMIDYYHAEKLFESAKEPKAFFQLDSEHSWIFSDVNSREILLDYMDSLDK